MLKVQGDGTIQSGMRISWTAPEGGQLRDYDVEWRVQGEEAFTGTRVRSALGSSFTVRPVVDGETYEVQVTARNLLGVQSATISKAHKVIGKTAAPSDVDVLIVEVLQDGTRVYDIIHNNVPVDVTHGGGYRIRYVSGTNFVWETATPLNQGLITAVPPRGQPTRPGRLHVRDQGRRPPSGNERRLTR